MNPYNDVVPYDYPMPYNGLFPTPSEDRGGGHHEVGDRRKKNQNMAAILAALEYYDEDYT